MVVGGLAMAVIMLCMAEVASQFDEPGGAYLYARTAFGRFAGMQAGWFSILSSLGGGAANASLFMIYLSGFLPWAAHGWHRVGLLTILIAVPAVANCIGIRSGATLSIVFTVAKLLPLALLITLGVVRFGRHFEVLHSKEITNPGLTPWLSALLLLIFAYGGIENALIPAGEVEEPHRTVPSGLLAGLLVMVIVYTFVQFVTVATIGASTTGRPLAETAFVLVGRGGGLFVTIAVMISTYGLVTGLILNIPRLACSLASQGDIPPLLGRLHSRFNTPSRAILLYAAVVWLLAATGTYLWLVALTGGAKLVIYAGACASLLRLRRQPQTEALRIPFGRGLAILGILIALAIVTRLHAREALLMGITALIASANWWWAKQRERRVSQAVIAAGASN
jgi:basic amino acid/polyamine antiporter, APA family